MVPGEQCYSEATNSRIYSSNSIIAFSDSIESFKGNIRSNVNNQLKEGRVRFKFFNWATSNDPLFYTEPTLGKSQFDPGKINVWKNDFLNKTIENKGLLQNILKIEARCKTYGISKVFVSKVLHTRNASSDIFSKLNFDIENI